MSKYYRSPQTLAELRQASAAIADNEPLLRAKRLASRRHGLITSDATSARGKASATRNGFD